MDNTCQWTVQLQPSNRTDGWGLGWLNLHTIEAMELATADAMQANTPIVDLMYANTCFLLTPQAVFNGKGSSMLLQRCF